MAPIISKPHQPILRAMLYLTTSTTTLAGSTYLVCSGDGHVALPEGLVLVLLKRSNNCVENSSVTRSGEMPGRCSF
ncbi:hypothetical protein BY996DRAFT_6489487 [Phakopsora pachyrhizi]|nr:hypothetical protein BY996DRAFT_6489487 [Phakopsora pachyrhizi]